MLIVLGLRRLKCNIVVVSDGVPPIEALYAELGCHVVSDEGRSPADVKAELLKLYELGYDYTFECNSYLTYGAVALEVCHKGWGQCGLLAAPDKASDMIETRPFQLVTGRHWVGALLANMQFGELFDADLAATRSGPILLNILTKIFNTHKPISIKKFTKN